MHLLSGFSRNLCTHTHPCNCNCIIIMLPYKERSLPAKKDCTLELVLACSAAIVVPEEVQQAGAVSYSEL